MPVNRAGREVNVRSGRAERPPEAVNRFIERLVPEERMLIVLKRELYEGSWGAMSADLHARLEGKPYVFKLANRIQDDMRRIDGLRAFEQAHGVDLADYVNLDRPVPS